MNRPHRRQAAARLGADEVPHRAITDHRQISGGDDDPSRGRCSGKEFRIGGLRLKGFDRGGALRLSATSSCSAAGLGFLELNGQRIMI
jgi:hypothetical protein